MMTLKSFRGDVKRISVAIPMLLAAFTANAQQPWTLDDCLQYARENNIDLQKREIEVELSKNSLNTAKNDWLPTIEFTAAQQFSFGNASASTGVMATEHFDANLSYTSGSLNVEMPLFDGFLRKNRQRSADWSVKEAVASLDHAHKNLTIQVATYYLQVLYEQGMAEVAEAQVEASRRLCEKTHALVEDGKSPKSDLADAEAQLATDEYNLTACRGKANIALLSLSQLLNLPSKDGFSIADIDDDRALSQELLNPIDLYTDASETHPAVVAAQAAVERSKYDIETARAGYYPRIDFRASLNTYYFKPFKGPGEGPFFNRINKNKSELLGVHLTVPIFNRLSTRNEIRRAKMLLTQSQLSLSDTQQKLRKEIDQAYYNAVDAKDRFQSAKKSEEASEIAYTYESDKYEAGRSTIYDLTQATLRLREARENAVQAKYEFIIRQKILDVYAQ